MVFDYGFTVFLAKIRSDVAIIMWVSAQYLVHHIGPALNISTTTGQIDMIFSTDLIKFQVCTNCRQENLIINE